MRGLGIMYDASKLPGKPFPGAIAVAAYIGGNTPNVATTDQWNAASDNGRLHMLPIWTGFMEADPIAHAKEAAQRARALGWAAHAIHTRYIALDMEDQVNSTWQGAFGEQLIHEGFHGLDYRSIDAILKNPTPANMDVWPAHWRVIPNMVEVPRIEAFQFINDQPWDGTVVDGSVITERCYNKLGFGPRR